MARDILGLGGPIDNDENVTNLEGTDRSTAVPDSERERRHRRMSEGADELTPDTTGALHRSSGATGIDMGSGGEGTDIE